MDPVDGDAEDLDVIHLAQCGTVITVVHVDAIDIDAGGVPYPEPIDAVPYHQVLGPKDGLQLGALVGMIVNPEAAVLDQIVLKGQDALEGGCHHAYGPTYVYSDVRTSLVGVTQDIVPGDETAAYRASDRVQEILEEVVGDSEVRGLHDVWDHEDAHRYVRKGAILDRDDQSTVHMDGLMKVQKVTKLDRDIPGDAVRTDPAAALDEGTVTDKEGP